MWWTDRWMHGWTVGRIDERVDRWIVVSPQNKISK
jgi:hypothetical protein